VYAQVRKEGGEMAGRSIARSVSLALVVGMASLCGCTQPKRYGSVIMVKPDKLEEYKKLHAHVWPAVLKMIHECNIRNYSIFYRDGYLFSYFEYYGKDYDADMVKMAADPTTQKWWAECKPCQQPVPSAKPGEWWAPMEQVFYTP
jgi:L-rhamnose mutarotase